MRRELDPGPHRKRCGQRQPSAGATWVRMFSITMSVVFDAELVGHGQQQRVRRLDRLVGAELLNEHIRLGRV